MFKPNDILSYLISKEKEYREREIGRDNLIQRKRHEERIQRKIDIERENGERDGEFVRERERENGDNGERER